MRHALTISLTTPQGLALFGTPRDTFAFTGLSLDAGTNLSDLKLVSETNFDAAVLNTGVNSVTIGINSLDTRFGPLATASFALPVASSVPVPEPASGIILATVLLGFGLSRRRTAVPVSASSISSGGRAGIVPRARSA